MQMDSFKSLVKKLEPNAESFDLGILALINNSIINFLLPAIIVVILINEKARHLIFANIEVMDPLITTFLIFALCLLQQKFYFQTRERVTTKENNIPGNFQNINEKLLLLLPLLAWMIFLFFTRATSHLFSILACIYFLILLLRFSASEEKRDENYMFKTPIILTTIFLTLFYNIMYYEFPSFEIFIEAHTFNFSNYKLFGFFLQTLAFLTTIYIIEKIEWIRGNKYYRIAAIVAFVLAIFVLLTVGSIRPFDVLILYFLILRTFIYYFTCWWNTIFSYTFFPNSVVKKSAFLTWVLPMHRRIFRVFMGLFLLLFIVLTFFNAYRGGNPNDRSQFELGSETSKIEQRSPFSTHVIHWLKNRQATKDPIYLVAGQGGGSRAGCAFLSAMCQMDSKMGNNLLAMTTISGSSNGAGFYLGLKYHDCTIPQTTNDLLRLNHKLYEKDYITHSLFKFLFTDAISSWLPYFKHRQNRNESLIARENLAFNSILDRCNDNTTNFLDNQWSQVYQNTDLPVFIPVTYNISRGVKAITSPYTLDGNDLSTFESILDEKSQNLSIGEGISLSEMFPLISASATINWENYIDGGVYDNGAFETLGDLYHIVRPIRDSISPNKKIIMLSIENGAFEAKKDTFDTELGAIIASASRSIFSSNPVAHYNAIDALTKNTIDTLHKIRIYPQDPDDMVVMSRYLNSAEINKIVSESASQTVQLNF